MLVEVVCLQGATYKVLFTGSCLQGHVYKGLFARICLPEANCKTYSRKQGHLLSKYSFLDHMLVRAFLLLSRACSSKAVSTPLNSGAVCSQKTQRRQLLLRGLMLTELVSAYWQSCWQSYF